MQDLTKEMNAAARQASVTGDRTQLDRVAREVDTATAAYSRLNRQLRETNQTAAASTTMFGQMTVATRRWAETTIAAFAGIQGIRKVADIFRDTAKEITELRNTAKAAAMEPGDVKVFQEALRESGESADGSRQALVRLVDQITETRIKMRGMRREPEGVTVHRGSDPADDPIGVNIYRGAQKNLQSVEELVERIRRRASSFATTKDQIISVLQSLAEVRKQDAQLATAAGVQLFGRRYAQLAEAINKLGTAGAWKKIEEELKATGRWPDPDAVKRVDEYNLALDDVGDSFEKLKMAIAIPLFPQVSEGLRQFAELIANFDQLKTKYQEFLALTGMTQLEEAVVGPIRRGLTGILDAIREFAGTLPGFLEAPLKILADTVKLSVDAITLDLSGAIRDFGTLVDDVMKAALAVVRGFSDAVVAVANALKSTFDAIWQQIQAAGAALGQLFGSKPAAEAAIPAQRMAAGGMVPGRGFGDSVRAWLTPGEFVIRRSVVDRLGADFFAGLNRGMGGLLPRNHYATGGLVMADVGGASVHLHLDNHIFSLRADQSVAESLMRTARAKQMLSAGRKPSWAGGRRYGG